MNSDLVFEKVGEGGKAMQFPVFTAFGIGLYTLMKVTGKKKFHRKGEEHGSARWANKKEINSLLDKPPKQKRKLADLFKRKPNPNPNPNLTNRLNQRKESLSRIEILFSQMT